VRGRPHDALRSGVSSGVGDQAFSERMGVSSGVSFSLRFSPSKDRIIVISVIAS